MDVSEAKKSLFLTVDFEDLTHAPHLLAIACDLKGLKIDSHQRLPLGKLTSMAKRRGVQEVYIDGKFSDGKDQMPDRIEKVIKQNSDFVSISVSAGASAIRAAVTANQNRINLVGTTVASDMPNEECIDVFGDLPRSVVPRLAEIALKNGLEYITCSAHEIPYVKQYKNLRNLKIIATGIRLTGDDPNDQIRIATPYEAVSNGADYLAVGRSITGSNDPERACSQVIENLLMINKG